MLTRRRLLQTAAVTLAACGPDEETAADGSMARPFSAADPGPWGDKVAIHQPAIYGALIDDARVRIWIEVEDAATGTPHEQTPEHYVGRLRVEDQDRRTVVDVGFPPQADARIVAVLELPATTTRLRVTEECNLHGAWVVEVDVAALRVAPVGDARRPLTAAQPGEWGDKIASHLPVVAAQADGSVRVDVGDRAADKLHVTEAEHYVDHVVVYDQDAQELHRVPVGPERVPTFTFTPPAGTTALRVVAFCNLHDYWETVVSLG